MATFQCFFSVQGTGGSPTGPDPENRVGDQDTESPVRPLSSGLQVPGEPGHCLALQVKKINVNTSSYLDVVEIARVA